MASSVERRAHMREFTEMHSLANLQIVDAATPSCDDVKALYAESRVHTFPDCFRCKKLECGDDNCNNTLIPVQVATFASYLRLFTTFLRSNSSFALFVEDDIKLSEHAEVLCEQALSAYNDVFSELKKEQPSLIQFGWALGEEHKHAGPVDATKFLGKMSNPAFALNKAMAS
jgi:GR25 family glycosyltransferase involved in LPS biosynthesis